MPQRVALLECPGLYLDPSPHLAPPGALKRALNVVLRRPGVLEPRYGIETYESVIGTTNFRAFKGFAFGNVPVVDTFDGATWITKSFFSGSWNTMTGSADPPYLTVGLRQFLEARKNLYLTSSTGVRKCPALGTTAARTGMPVCPTGVVVTAAGTWLTAGQSVAYRAVYRRVDASNLEVTGPPSSRMVFTAAGSEAVNVTVPVQSGVVAGDFVDVYRSESVTGTPSNEMRFVRTVKVSAAHVTAGYLAFDDFVVPTERGHFLYSSPSREGSGQLNYAPPKAGALGSFAGCTLYGNLAQPYRISIKLLSITGAEGFRSVTATGGTSTDASPIITGLSSTTGFKAGQSLTATGFTGAFVLTVDSATQVTATVNSVGSVAGTLSVTCKDYLQIDGVKFYATAASSIQNMVEILAYTINGALGAGTGSASTVAVIGEDDPTRLDIEERYIGAMSSTTMYTTASTAWTPAAGGNSVFNANTGPLTWLMENDRQPNAICWSKPDQPEHVPLGTVPLGNENSAVLGFGATTDACFIFKQDGIWRLTGTGPDDFRLDLVSNDHRLLRAETLATFDGEIYGWFDSGVCAVSSGGIRLLSGPINEALREYQDDASTYLGGGFGICGVASAVEGIYVLGACAPDDAVAARTFVWNARLGAWTEWDTGWRAMWWSDDDGRLYFGTGAANTIKRQIREFGEHWDRHDGELACTISLVQGSQITFSAAQSLVVGDGVGLGGPYDPVAKVISVQSSTLVTVDDPSLVVAGGAFVYTGFTTTVEWLPFSLGDPTQLKQWSDVVLRFDGYVSLYTATLGFASDVSTTSVDYTDTAAQVWTTQPRVKRAGVPRSANSGTELRVVWSCRQATAQWQLTGLAIQAEAISDRGAP